MKVKELSQQDQDRIKNHYCDIQDCSECWLSINEKCCKDDVEQFLDAVENVKRYGERCVPEEVVKTLLEMDGDVK